MRGYVQLGALQRWWFHFTAYRRGGVPWLRAVLGGVQLARRNRGRWYQGRPEEG